MENLYKKTVNIVFGTNNKYAPYLTVALKSLIDNTSAERKYKIYIFESDIDDNLKSAILSMINNIENISIEFINTDAIYNGYDTEKLFCHLHFSKEMYLRGFIPQVLSDKEKAIYIDCDTIVQGDVAELFDIELGDNYLAAVKDFNTILNYRYYPNVKIYFDQCLHFTNVANYFNSGVLLMDLQKLREIKLPDKMFELLDFHKELLYPDQDLLNLICDGKVKIIDNNWNYVFAINPAIVQDHNAKELALEYVRGISEPKIIHYLSEHKPWDLPDMFYGDIWWKWAKKTPIYQNLLKAYFDKHPEALNNVKPQ